MKVILSIDAIRYPLTGIGRYTQELATHLQSSSEISDLRYFVGRRFVDSLPVPDAVPVPAVSNGVKRTALKTRAIVEAYRIVSPWLKARALRGFDDHVFHGPNFYLPPFGGKGVVTMHDLSPFTWSHCHPPERVRYMQAEIRQTLKRASVLITDSEFTRRELAGYFSWPIERIHAVPLATGPDFRPRGDEELRAALARHGLKKCGYCLYAGTIEPRKNVGALLDAYGMLAADVRARWPLVLVGYEGWRSETIHARITEAEREGWVRYLGYVPAADLPLLYAGARLFAFPSLYEGFGLPVLEAMASGVPVVCSDSSSLPEVVGDAAAMCAAEDVDALNELLWRGLADEVWRRDAVEKGLQQARRFSWQRCAQETAAAYRAAAQC